MPHFTGQLSLDNQNQRAWLTYPDNGAPRTDLMTQEPPPAGTGASGALSAIWARYRYDPTTPSNSTVQVDGYLVETPGLRPILHVTQS